MRGAHRLEFGEPEEGGGGFYGGGFFVVEGDPGGVTVGLLVGAGQEEPEEELGEVLNWAYRVFGVSLPMRWAILLGVVNV